MAFTKGQRVRVPNPHRQAPSHLWGKTGVVTDVGVGQPDRLRDESGLDEPVERQYEVKFDGDDQDQLVWESWLVSE